MLLAQADPSAAASDSLVLLLPVLAGLAFVGMGVLVSILAFNYARRSREMTHEERLRAIEHGQPLEEPNSSHAKFMHNAFWISFWLVALVPSASFSAAASATEGGGYGAEVMMMIWLGAGAASVAAVVSAAVLMLAARRPKSSDEYAWSLAKPEKKDLYV